ncbi:PRC-barrel domain-containing protein [Cryptosporangium minutisporangium]|uniref:PRC-barrel domain-containing protein n=1 Tax=Cryptosporangium minutisporangium TaxID=113569 RepID=UPI0031EBB752
MHATAYDQAGSKLGKIGQVYLDNRTQAPEWVTVHTGLFGTKESFVPVGDAELDGDRLRLPYDKQLIKTAPDLDPAGPFGGLTPEQERDLYRHYGVEPPAPPVVSDAIDPDTGRISSFGPATALDGLADDTPHGADGGTAPRPARPEPPLDDPFTDSFVAPTSPAGVMPPLEGFPASDPFPPRETFPPREPFPRGTGPGTVPPAPEPGPHSAGSPGPGSPGPGSSGLGSSGLGSSSLGSSGAPTQERFGPHAPEASRDEDARRFPAAPGLPFPPVSPAAPTAPTSPAAPGGPGARYGLDTPSGQGSRTGERTHTGQGRPDGHGLGASDGDAPGAQPERTDPLGSGPVLLDFRPVTLPPTPTPTPIPTPSASGAAAGDGEGAGSAADPDQAAATSPLVPLYPSGPAGHVGRHRSPRR